MKKDRSTFWAEGIFNPVYDYVTGDLRELIGVIRDINDKKQKEIEILEGTIQKENLLREIHHRVKNNFAILVSLINMQKDQSVNPDLLEALTNLQLRIRTMALVHEMIYRSENLQSIPFSDYLKSIATMVAAAHRNVHAPLNLSLEEMSIDLDTAIPLGLIVNEILSNTYKHAFVKSDYKGTIHIELKRDTTHDVINLMIQDDGCGFPDGFSYEKSETMGLHIINLLVKQIEGTLSIINSKGVTIIIRFHKSILKP